MTVYILILKIMVALFEWLINMYLANELIEAQLIQLIKTRCEYLCKLLI